MPFEKLGSFPSPVRYPQQLDGRFIGGDTINVRELLARDGTTRIVVAEDVIGMEANETYFYGHIRRDQFAGTYHIGDSPYPFSTIYYDTLSNTSDRRKKRRIRKLRQGLAFVQALRPVRFRWRPEHSEDRSEQWGFIAQEVEELTGKGPVQRDGDNISLDYTQLIPALVNAIQELAAEVEALRNGG